MSTKYKMITININWITTEKIMEKGDKLKNKIKGGINNGNTWISNGLGL